MFKILFFFACLYAVSLAVRCDIVGRSLRTLSQDEFCSGSEIVGLFPEDILQLLDYLYYCYESSRISGKREGLKNFVFPVENSSPIPEAFPEPNLGPSHDPEMKNNRIYLVNIANENLDDSIKDNIIEDMSQICKPILTCKNNNSITGLKKLFPKAQNKVVYFPLVNFTLDLKSMDAMYVLLDFILVTLRCLESAEVDHITSCYISSRLLRWVEHEIMPLLSNKENNRIVKKTKNDDLEWDYLEHDGSSNNHLYQDENQNRDVIKLSTVKNRTNYTSMPHNDTYYFLYETQLIHFPIIVLILSSILATLLICSLLTLCQSCCCRTKHKTFIKPDRRSEIMYHFNTELDSIIKGYKSKTFSQIFLNDDSTRLMIEKREKLAQDEIYKLHMRCVELADKINIIINNYLNAAPVYRSSSDLKGIISIVSESLEDDEKQEKTHNEKN